MEDYGCEETVLRKDLATHMEESELQHLTNMAMLNLDLTRQLQQDLAEKDEKIAQLQQEMAEQRQLLKEEMTKQRQEMEKTMVEQKQETKKELAEMREGVQQIVTLHDTLKCTLQDRVDCVRSSHLASIASAKVVVKRFPMSHFTPTKMATTSSVCM